MKKYFPHKYLIPILVFPDKTLDKQNKSEHRKKNKVWRKNENEWIGKMFNNDEEHFKELHTHTNTLNDPMKI